jgi:hypothetical protein
MRVWPKIIRKYIISAGKLKRDKKAAEFPHSSGVAR